MIKYVWIKQEKLQNTNLKKVSIEGLAGYELGEKMLQRDLYVFTASSASTTPKFFL